MDPGRIPTGTRRRLVATALAAGLVAGVGTGAALLTRAAPETGGPVPLVLHAGPALVEAGQPVTLTAATYCAEPSAPSCTVTRAEVLVRPSGVAGWTAVRGRRTGGTLTFRVSDSQVTSDGFSYWLRLITGDGTTITYPPGGEVAAIRVLTVTGLPIRSLTSFSWADRLTARSTVLWLRPGTADGRVGFSGRNTEEGLLGPSSFDVTPTGDLVVADWVHARLQRFAPDGRLLEVTPLPVRRPVDVAAGPGGMALTTLGTGATAFELDDRGEVLGRYPVAYGVASRILGAGAPRVRVGNAQWVPVRTTVGQPLRPEAQSLGQTTTPPSSDGSIGISQDVGDRVAFVWTRPDGSRTGAILRFPPGVAPGADYFVRPLGDGGALAARGVWDATHFGVLVLRFDAAGTVAAAGLLPEPSTRIAAPYSTIRFLDEQAVVMAVDSGRAIRIDRFTVR